MSSCWRLRQVQRGFSDPCHPLHESVPPACGHARRVQRAAGSPAGSIWFFLVLLQEMDGSQCPSRVQHELNSIPRKARQAPEHLRGPTLLTGEEHQTSEPKNAIRTHTSPWNTGKTRTHPRFEPARVKSTMAFELATSSARITTLAFLAPFPFVPPDSSPSHVWSRAPTIWARAHSAAPWKSCGKERHGRANKGEGGGFSSRSTEAMCGGLWKFTGVGLENVVSNNVHAYRMTSRGQEQQPDKGACRHAAEARVKASIRRWPEQLKGPRASPPPQTIYAETGRAVSQQIGVSTDSRCGQEGGTERQGRHADGFRCSPSETI